MSTFVLNIFREPYLQPTTTIFISYSK